MKPRTQQRVLALVAIAVMYPLFSGFLYMANRSMCAFDACKPMTWADIWLLPALAVVVILPVAVLPSAPTTPTSEDQP